MIDDDGHLRAFHNVCRHRAGPLVTDDDGHCSVIVCAYHGWVYGLDGSLKRARDFGDAADFNAEDLGLFPVAVDEWRGLIFVRIATDGPGLLETLGGLVDRCADHPIESLTYSQRLTHRIDANWKTYTDNYGEGYHIPFIHPGLHRQIETSEYRVDVQDGFTEHRVPTRDGAVASGVWLWRYPNLALNIYPEGMNIERWLPEGPRRTRVIYDCFVADPTATAANADIVRLAGEVLDEDRAICELVQQNLESGIYTEGRLSPRHENGVHAFQTWVRDALR
jgi:Phenylpropionate dioxygenase and related ring-hydroxylating dioxygenases, large terminal subunit